MANVVAGWRGLLRGGAGAGRDAPLLLAAPPLWLWGGCDELSTRRPNSTLVFPTLPCPNLAYQATETHASSLLGSVVLRASVDTRGK